MAEKRTKIRAKLSTDGSAEIIVLITHPMETGQRINPQTKDKVAPHFVQKISFLLNGKEVAVMDTGWGVSANPLISIRLKQTKRGDKLKVAWSDNLGDKDEEEIVIGDES